ncbi:MAG: L,D-transpeptidase [Mesorhizobium sp.]|nr:L,D-transpeptidase [Mesorhizobium sp.]
MSFSPTNRFINIAAVALAGLGFVVGLGPIASHAAVNAKVVAVVDISDQTMLVTVAGRPTFEWKVSTAGKGYVTPTGAFKPYRMHEMWYSKKYDNAPMPHSVFYDGGYAVHATPHVKRLGQPASHGCVRLSPKNAEAFYQIVEVFGPGNTEIHIVE